MKQLFQGISLKNAHLKRIPDMSPHFTLIPSQPQECEINNYDLLINELRCSYLIGTTEDSDNYNSPVNSNYHTWLY